MSSTQPAQTTPRRYQLFIDGQFVDAESGKTFESPNPATGETFAEVAEADKADVDKAVAIAHQLRLGQIHVNGFGTCPGQPFGGFKQSGIGRKGGPEGLEGYLETKLLQVHG